MMSIRTLKSKCALGNIFQSSTAPSQSHSELAGETITAVINTPACLQPTLNAI